MYLLYAAATLVSTLSIASASYHSGLNDVHDLFGRDIYTASDIALGRRGDGSSTGSGSISGQGSFRSQGSQGSTSSQGSMKMQGSSGHSGSMKAGGGCFKARCDHMAKAGALATKLLSPEHRNAITEYLGSLGQKELPAETKKLMQEYKALGRPPKRSKMGHTGSPAPGGLSSESLTTKQKLERRQAAAARPPGIRGLITRLLSMLGRKIEPVVARAAAASFRRLPSAEKFEARIQKAHAKCKAACGI